MKPLFQLPETTPTSTQTGQGFALSRSRFLPTQRIGKHMIRPENCAELLENLPAPGCCLHAVVRGDFILNDLITQLVRQIALAEYPDLSDRALAEWCGVSDVFVGKKRKDQVQTVCTSTEINDLQQKTGIPELDEEYQKAVKRRKGRDGKEYPYLSDRALADDGKRPPVPVLTIGTLSMNPENARELRKLLDEGLVGKITMVISDYFFRTSRDATEECFSILPSPGTTWIKTRSHVKIALIPSGRNAYVLHGSANLRSSANLENLTLENDRALLDWHQVWISELQTTKNL